MPLKYIPNYLTGGNSMAAKEVKMCDLPARIAALVFKSLNYGKLELYIDGCGNRYIITDVEPMRLTYPEGWYYAKGVFIFFYSLRYEISHIWSFQPESNWRPQPYHGCALPTEL